MLQKVLVSLIALFLVASIPYTGSSQQHADIISLAADVENSETSDHSEHTENPGQVVSAEESMQTEYDKGGTSNDADDVTLSGDFYSETTAEQGEQDIKVDEVSFGDAVDGNVLKEEEKTIKPDEDINNDTEDSAHEDEKGISGKLTLEIVFADETKAEVLNGFSAVIEMATADLQKRISETTDPAMQAYLLDCLEHTQSDSLANQISTNEDGNTILDVPLVGMEVTINDETVVTGKDGAYEFSAPVQDNAQMAIGYNGTELIEVHVEKNLDNVDDDVTVTIDSEQMMENINQMAETMASTQAYRYYRSYQNGTTIGYGKTAMYISEKNGWPHCNKVDKDFSPYTTANNDLDAHFSQTDVKDVTSFAIADSDCSVSVKYAVMYMSNDKPSPYPDTLNCFVEAIAEGKNIYCNGTLNRSDGREKGGHINCSWFAPINHPEVLHSHYTPGWNYANGSWYCYGQPTPGGAGAALTNQWQPDSAGMCYLGSDGRAYMNVWQTIGGYRYYFDSAGRRLQNQWQSDSIGYCYLGSDGRAYANSWQYINGSWYYFNLAGRRLQNQWQLDSVGYCYLGSDGRAYVNSWRQINGSWYYFDSAGRRLQNQWRADSVGMCYLGYDGRAYVNSWRQIGGYWYYFNSAARRLQNQWQPDSAGMCYLRADGRAYQSCSAWIGGKLYYFDAFARCTNYW
ncbi:MAG: hypothetical protein LBG97_03855 [Coriobacteriales bacterium]|jgi:glucan-binding YG repeat protein|nr:hypothetical protein [Coriobacteriales bacterium]